MICRSAIHGLRLAALATLVAALICAASSASADDSPLVGLWLTAPDDEGRSHVEIEADGETYRGRIVWLENPTYPEDDPEGMAGEPRVDRNNPDPALRQRPILGLELLGGFQAAGERQWQGGRIYDPTNGKTYKCKMRLEGETLHVRGFIGFSLIGRTTEWTRVTDP